ncbi:hypothetical protein COB72_07860 [bacterium]|nr:MAG: hypothetical protein COB72_07860 [bacterium]
MLSLQSWNKHESLGAGLILSKINRIANKPGKLGGLSIELLMSSSRRLRRCLWPRINHRAPLMLWLSINAIAVRVATRE